MYDDTYADDTPMMDDPASGESDDPGGGGSGSGYSYQLYVDSISLPVNASSVTVTGNLSCEVISSHSRSQGSRTNVTSDTPSFLVTVASGSNSFGSGNKFYIDMQGTPQLRDIVTESTTYRFDQSDVSNAGHPLVFSTTPDGSHASGSPYTSGVTSVGTPGTTGAYTEVTFALNSTPYLYYYCQNHSGMGSDPWSSEGFDGEINGTPIASIYGWTAANETSPAIYYGRLGSFNSVSDPSTTWAQLSVPSDGRLNFSYNADSSDERVYVYKNGSLQETLTYSVASGSSGSAALQVSAGDEIKFAFESLTYTAWIDDISLQLPSDFSLAVTGSQVASEAASPITYMTRKVNRTANFW
jgi:hypothetical protein